MPSMRFKIGRQYGDKIADRIQTSVRLTADEHRIIYRLSRTFRVPVNDILRWALSLAIDDVLVEAVEAKDWKPPRYIPPPYAPKKTGPHKLQCIAVGCRRFVKKGSQLCHVHGPRWNALSSWGD